MKAFILAALIAAVIFLRLNLPPTNINDNIIDPDNADILQQLASKVLLSNTVADWKYLDFIVVRYACSERLKMSLIGLPFSRWKLYEQDVTSCP